MTGCLAQRKDVYYVRLTYYDKTHTRKDKWVSTGLSGRGAKQKATANVIINKPPRAQHLSPCRKEYRSYNREHLRPDTEDEASACVNSGLIRLQTVFARCDACLLFKCGGEIIDIGKTGHLCYCAYGNVARLKQLFRLIYAKLGNIFFYGQTGILFKQMTYS